MALQNARRRQNSRREVMERRAVRKAKQEDAAAVTMQQLKLSQNRLEKLPVQLLPVLRASDDCLLQLLPVLA